MSNEEVRKYWENFPEAPASDTFKWIDADGYEHMSTVRAWSGASLPEMIARTKEAIQAAGGAPLGKRSAVVSEPAQESDGEKKAFEHKPVPVSELPEGLPEGEYFKDEFDYFVVEPQPDNKATVKFYKDKLEWAVGATINKWKNENVKKALEPLAEIDPTKAEKYRVAGVQFWTKGNEYTISKGDRKGQKSHYKDFRAVQQTL